MRCPHCGAARLRVEVAFSGKVPCSFGGEGEFELLDSVAFDSEWHDHSECECLECGWMGQVGEAQSGRKPPVVVPTQTDDPAPYAGPLTEADLQQIRQQLAVGYCNPIWRRHIERLLGEVQRLSALLDSIARLSGNPSVGKRKSDDDTTVG